LSVLWNPLLRKYYLHYLHLILRFVKLACDGELAETRCQGNVQ